MPMNAAGAQGLVTGTLNLSTSANVLLSAEISVYTVPNITDQFAQIDYTVFWELMATAGGSGSTNWLGGAIGTPGATRDLLWSLWPPTSESGVRGTNTNAFFVEAAYNNTAGAAGQFHGELKLGPNTAFKIPVFYRANTVNGSGPWNSIVLSYAIQYHSLYTKIS